MTRVRAVMRRREHLLICGAAGLGGSLGVIGLTLKAGDAAHPLWDLIFGGIAGFLFLGAGVVAHVRRPDNRVGLLMVLVAAGWFAEDLQFSGNMFIHTLGIALTRASSAFAAHLVLAFPTGRLMSRLDKALAVAAYLAAFAVPCILLPWVESNPPNPFLIKDDPALTRALTGILNPVEGVIGAGVLVALVRHWVQATAPMRRVLQPVFGTGMVGAVTTVVGRLLPQTSYSTAALIAYKIAFCILPLIFLAALLQVRIGPARVDTLLAQLRRTGSREAMREVLARALGDPSLRIGYWSPEQSMFVDECGRPAALRPAGSARSLTVVRSDGLRIAVLIHDPALEEDRAQLEAVAAAAALVLDRQRLREGIVAAMDAERRRIERDLHDGAQQSLVLAMLHLHRAVEDLGGQAPAPLVAGIRSLDAAHDELRELAQGGHPALLGAAGLGPALETLIQRMPLPVTADLTAVPRLPDQIEITAYFVVKEALTNIVKHADAAHAWVTLSYNGSGLHVEVGDDGIGGAVVGSGSGLSGLLHRLLVLGGELTVDSQVNAGTRVAASMPYQMERSP
jgi:signal transduction histidine kinase